MNIKLTSQQIKEIKKHKKANWSYARLAERYNVCERTIRRIAGISHIYSNYNGNSRIFDGIGDNPEEIPLFIRENLEKAKFNEPTERIKRGVCVICGKEKEKKFHLTRYCSLKCFGVLTY